MLLLEKENKISAKTLAKAAVTQKTSILFGLQPLLEDVKTKDHLEKIISDMQMVEKLLLDKSKTELADLVKNFEKTENELDKIIKKIRSFQDFAADKEVIFKEKLLSKVDHIKLAKKDIQTQENYRKQANETIAEIRNILGKAQEKLKELSGKTETAMKLYHVLKPKLDALSLPENILQSEQSASKLKKRLELLCQATAEINASTVTTLRVDKEKIQSLLPQLQNTVKSCGQLIERTIVNLKPLSITNGENNAGNAHIVVTTAASATTVAGNPANGLSLSATYGDAKNESQFRSSLNA